MPEDHPAPSGPAGPGLQRPGEIEIGVVIPAYKQPGFLAEALDSVLAQRGPYRIGAVVVNDGCPFAQTHEVALSFARRHPDRVVYLRRANGGLSAARNTGVEFILAAWPACRSIFPLDADNRLMPPFLARAQALLDESPADTGWLYPDFDFFGLEGNFSTAGEYSHLLQVLENFCEAGSLVRREVFASGLRYDEAMRAGFEDWAFWLCAAAAGWRGRHLPASGFRYRKRAESMLATSERQRAQVLGDMRRRHAAHLGVRSLARLEAAELPRYGLQVMGEDSLRLVLDPQAVTPRRLKRAEAHASFVEASREPRAVFFPPQTCWASQPALDLLAGAGLLRGIFHQAALLLRSAHFVAVTLAEDAAGGLGLDVLPVPGSEDAPASAADAVLLFGQTPVMEELARDPYRGWVNSLAAPVAQPKLARIVAVLPPGLVVAPPPAIVAYALGEIDAMRDAMRSRSVLPLDWRSDDRRPRRSAYEAYAEFARCGAILPHLPAGDGRDIGFLLPLFAFGGVEKVVFNYAAVLRARGWRPHLFISGAQRIQAFPGHFDVFESVCFFGADGIEGGDWDRLHFGACTSGFAQWRDTRDAVGLLATMDVVLNTHALGGHGLMQALRRQGVRCWLGLHLVEKGPLGAPMGNPHIALAYEGAYDGFVVISERLRDWCVGQAVPADKVVKVLNAPSYAADPARLAAALATRQVAVRRPLRVLFLGRLDAQKGLDRLRDIILQTRGPAVEWRLVGKPVLDDAGVDPATLGVPVEPPAMDGPALDALYAWADVVVLPSRFEGVPLTLLEAQRFGCVVIATEVGAVAEIVRDRVDGLLVPDGGQDAAVVAGFTALIGQLAADRDRLRQIGQAAAARIGATSWAQNMQDWLERIEALRPKESDLRPAA